MNYNNYWQHDPPLQNDQHKIVYPSFEPNPFNNDIQEPENCGYFKPINTQNKVEYPILDQNSHNPLGISYGPVLNEEKSQILFENGFPNPDSKFSQEGQNHNESAQLKYPTFTTSDNGNVNHNENNVSINNSDSFNQKQNHIISQQQQHQQPSIVNPPKMSFKAKIGLYTADKILRTVVKSYPQLLEYVSPEQLAALHNLVLEIQEVPKTYGRRVLLEYGTQVPVLGPLIQTFLLFF